MLAFLGVWAISFAVVLSSAHRDRALGALPIAIVAGVLVVLTAKLTGAPQTPAVRTSRRLLLAQVSVLVVVIVLTGLRGMTFHGVAPVPLAEIPIWSPFVKALERAGSFVGNANYVANPVLYVVIPLALVALGARPRELGFGPGHRVWALVGLWGALPLILRVYLLATGQQSLPQVLQRFGSNLLQNGFSEEFLFRGALLTRLVPMVGVTWAMTISSLSFGLWHLGLETRQAGGDLVLAAFITVLVQGTSGLAYAFLYWRSRNLVAPSIVHALGNV